VDAHKSKLLTEGVELDRRAQVEEGETTPKTFLVSNESRCAESHSWSVNNEHLRLARASALGELMLSVPTSGESCCRGGRPWVGS
jgi:hypothetical protein